MSKKSRSDKFHFGFQSIIRLVIFILLVIFSINYFSANSLKISIPLPSLIQYLPPDSQAKLNILGARIESLPLEQKVTQFIVSTQDFISKQIQQIKIDIINAVAKNLVDKINSP
ncbi:MAG: hypothetical protein WAV41_04955 [Microgenomates group bacterium]